MGGERWRNRRVLSPELLNPRLESVASEHKASRSGPGVKARTGGGKVVMRPVNVPFESPGSRLFWLTDGTQNTKSGGINFKRVMVSRRALLGAAGAGTMSLGGCVGMIEDAVTPYCDEGEPLQAVSGSWPTRGGSPGHRAFVDDGRFEEAPRERWCRASPGNWQPPVLAAGSLILAETMPDNEGFRLHSRAAATGEVDWIETLPGDPIDQPTVYENGIFLAFDGDPSDFISRYDLATGQLDWRTELDRATDSMVTVEGTSVFITDVAGYMFAFDATTGEQEWETNVSSRIDPSARGNLPAVVDGTVFVDAGIGEGPAALAATDGEILWQRDIPMFLWPATNGDILVGGDRMGVHTLDAGSGETLWSIEQSKARLAPIVLTDEQVIIPFADDTVSARDASTGTEQWSITVSNPVRQMFATPQTVVFGTRADLTGVDVESGEEVWTTNRPLFDCIPANSALFGTHNDRLLALEGKR